MWVCSRESRSEEEDGGEAYLNAKEDEWVEERQRRIEHSNQHGTHLGHGTLPSPFEGTLNSYGNV